MLFGLMVDSIRGQGKRKATSIAAGHGYTLQDSLKIPGHIWNIARIRSGYNGALNELAEARYQLANTKIQASIFKILSQL